jgi:hypothetical protein
MAQNIIKVINEKNIIYNTKTPKQPQIELPTIEEMIKALKFEGYKILKPFTDYQEL